MKYATEYQATQMMGIGYLGEVRQGPDGSAYQWVQGVDGLGNPIGFWRKLRRLGKRLVRRAMPLAQRIAPFVPGGAAALTAVAPILKQAGVAGLSGLGALYQAPDGAVYQMEGLGQDDDLQGLSDDDVTQMMGMGYLGEVRPGPDGNVYQFVQGVDGLGNPIGFWKRLRRLARRAVKAAMPLAQRIAPFIPGGAAALTAVAPIARAAGVAGLGALYEASDGSVYQVQGMADDQELQGIADDEELQGLDEDEELQGFAQDEELQGLMQDEELQGLAQEEDLQGIAQDEELQGLDQGYVRDDTVSGLEAYVPDQAPATRWFSGSGQSPDMWKPLW
jgi:hypothetical protein